MKWITRERPKIDRIACRWLIKKFVDKEAEYSPALVSFFRYVFIQWENNR
jgi:hypothetical protein